ncbi:nucleotidyl transferase AbiEii/AbiGii toxin family protein [Actinoplanes sp. HUAS TT8]|uniref:nucleotidyl transferase AbiEii/AbiGii toxin family protein n=1 Tax=Actinoplanes sp. HUAS TT8 TaxID=3447453 RepID=UPI003F51CA84
MTEISGDFETHLTVRAGEADALAAFAAEHGVKFLEIELDRGETAVQPMLTLHGSGTLMRQVATAHQWCDRLRAAGIDPIRRKIEATPWSTGVPQARGDVFDEPVHRYFEHHIKLRLPPGADLGPITALAAPHSARLSRNARTRSADGSEVRFVNQRCRRVGRSDASKRLDLLVAALREAGHDVVSVEQEYVVLDDNLALDDGWLRGEGQAYREESVAPEYRPGFPATYHRVPEAQQGLVFDPALKQHPRAYRAGEPVFDDPATGEHWRAARQEALRHVLTVLAGGFWGRYLVLRGSAAMPAWVGAARDPGDLDFVVVPASVTSGSAEAEALIDGIVRELAARPGAGLRADRVTRSAIWTYERADGMRLVVPFRVRGVPDGAVQIDLVFGEELPIPPEPLRLPGVAPRVLAATAELSLAWKLLWLATDTHPQGKDLYDAVLLAEHTTVDLAVVRDLMRAELDDRADEFTAGSVLGWADVAWGNFDLEYPELVTDANELPWLQRLALALDRAWA